MVKEVTAYAVGDNVFSSKKEAATFEALERITEIVGNRPIAKQIVDHSSEIMELLEAVHAS